MPLNIIDRRHLLIIAVGYASGLVALPWLPGPSLDPEQSLFARAVILFFARAVIAFAAFPVGLSGDARAASALATDGEIGDEADELSLSSAAVSAACLSLEDFSASWLDLRRA